MPAEGLPSFLWIEQIPEVGQRTRLGVEASRYVARVCRVRSGERITLTDGRGAIGSALVIESARQVEIEVATLDVRLPTRTAMVLCGAPERGRADWMVEKLAELGVTALQPVDSERAQWAPGEARVERWQRLAVAALQQSRRRFLMTVNEPIPLEAAIEMAPNASDSCRFVADPRGEAASRIEPPSAAVGAIGPAEGFSPSELERMTSAGYAGIALSDSRLRTETAAIAWASWWSGGGLESGSNSIGL